jgi:hypothetical protein
VISVGSGHLPASVEPQRPQKVLTTPEEDSNLPKEFSPQVQRSSFVETPPRLKNALPLCFRHIEQ